MQLNFDPRSVNIQTYFEKLPNGEYPFVVTGDEHNVEKKALFLKLTVQPGHVMAGKTHSYRLGLWSDSPEEYRIAWESLAKLCTVLGVAPLNDTRDLYGKPFIGVLTTSKDPKYQDTRVKGIDGRTPYEIQSGKSSAPAAPSFAPPPPSYPQAPTAPSFNPQAQQPAASVPWGAPPPNNAAPPAWAK